MQAQATKPEQNQDVLTAQQSLQSVQTLLRAGLGCITYLRNLLPTDNFSESYLTSGNTESRCPSSVNGSFASESGKRNVSGFKIMTVTRGFTEEADKLLDYLEFGIFDALQKQYLRSFIFAIYLDSQDPNNIVEAYTFNFQYYNVPGTDISVPIMSLGDDLMRLSISGSNDPVVNASKKGKAPTLGDVKRSLKSLIKNLIQATTQMDALPRRRFATFKLFYYEHTPDDYEPPHFKPGDVKKDKWFFATHDRQEVPEKCSIGTVQTGWHGVDLRVASIAGYLPSVEDNSAPFCGTTSGYAPNTVPPLTPAEEAVARLQQVEQQKEDAMERKVVWDAENGLGDTDADGDAEEEDGSQVIGTWRVRPTGSVEFMGPIGMRDEDGNIVPLPHEDASTAKEVASSAEAQFRGIKEKVPLHIAHLDSPVGSIECTQTQPIDWVPGSPLSPYSSSPSSTPQPAPPRKSVGSKARTVVSDISQSPLPPSDPIESSQEFIQDGQGDQLGSQSIDTQLLKEVIINRQGLLFPEEDTEMLDTNTQLPGYQSVTNTSPIDDSTSIECECGVNVDDADLISCDGNCRRWFHLWCMGYHGSTDQSLPQKFICFDCRVQADQNWDLIVVHDLHPVMMAKFRDLALFRRAIKICEMDNPDGLAAFTSLIGCEPIVASQLFKRLENEGFVALETIEQDESGMLETRSTRSKNKKATRAKSRRKTTQKQRYVFMYAMKTSQLYQDYFNPTPEVERRVLSLGDLGPRRKSERKRKEHLHDKQNMDATTSKEFADPLQTQEEQMGGVNASKSQEERLEDAMMASPSPSQVESQTQAETQLMLDTQMEEPDPNAELKRKTTALSDESSRKTKKVKVSIGLAVDLGD